MARRKLSEYKAKQLLFNKLQQPYSGIPVKDIKNEELIKLNTLNKTKNYVVKVDQGVKKRGKQGLIAVKISPFKIKQHIIEFSTKGYSQFLVEEFVEHTNEDEHYLSLERAREGIVLRYSTRGGIDIEDHLDEVQTAIIPAELMSNLPFWPASPKLQRGELDQNQKVSLLLGISSDFLHTLLTFFEEEYLSFLEVNPLVIKNNHIYLLDLAVEVDSAAEFFVKNAWTSADFVEASTSSKTPEEQAVIQLKENSQASLKLDVLNKDGSLFTLLSGGGASITLADEAQNLGFGNELANYADYSGNPNQEETYLYTKQLLSLLLKSHATKKALIIGGGVANFTDVRITFRGILQALKDVVTELQKQQVRVFVRRGGPNQEEGLSMMSDFLMQNNILGGVWDQRMVLTEVVREAIEYVRH